MVCSMPTSSGILHHNHPVRKNMADFSSDVGRIISSSLSILGSGYITIAYLSFPETRSANRHLLFVLGLLDFFMAVAYALPVSDPTSPWCRAQAVSIGVFASASIVWTTCIAYNVYHSIHYDLEVSASITVPTVVPPQSPAASDFRTLAVAPEGARVSSGIVDPDSEIVASSMTPSRSVSGASTPLMSARQAPPSQMPTSSVATWKYHVVTWIFAGVIGLYVLVWSEVSIEKQGWCFSKPSYGIGLFYFPLWIVWALNIYFYLSSRARLRRVLDTYLTSSSQSVAQGVFSKFLWIPIVLVALRLGGSIDRVLIVIYDHSPWALTFLQSIGDPAQGLANGLMFGLFNDAIRRKMNQKYCCTN